VWFEKCVECCFIYYMLMQQFYRRKLEKHSLDNSYIKNKRVTTQFISFKEIILLLCNFWIKFEKLKRLSFNQLLQYQTILFKGNISLYMAHDSSFTQQLTLFLFLQISNWIGIQIDKIYNLCLWSYWCAIDCSNKLSFNTWVISFFTFINLLHVWNSCLNAMYYISSSILMFTYY
jgi:hypothetical protein